MYIHTFAGSLFKKVFACSKFSSVYFKCISLNAHAYLLLIIKSWLLVVITIYDIVPELGHIKTSC